MTRWENYAVISSPASSAQQVVRSLGLNFLGRSCSDIAVVGLSKHVSWLRPDQKLWICHESSSLLLMVEYHLYDTLNPSQFVKATSRRFFLSTASY